MPSPLSSAAAAAAAVVAAANRLKINQSDITNPNKELTSSSLDNDVSYAYESQQQHTPSHGRHTGRKKNRRRIIGMGWA
jgi:hypothetical protein